MPVSQTYWIMFAQGAREMRDLWMQMVRAVETRQFEDVPEIWAQIHELAEVLTANLEAIRTGESRKPS